MKQKVSVKVRATNWNLITVQILSNTNRTFEAGEILTLEYDDFRKPRTLDQNSFFHLCVRRMLPRFKEFDPRMTEDGLKHLLKEEFLTETVEAEHGGHTFSIRVTRDTKDLSKIEFSDFFNLCIDFFRAEGIEAPIDAFLDEYEETVKEITRLENISEKPLDKAK